MGKNTIRLWKFTFSQPKFFFRTVNGIRKLFSGSVREHATDIGDSIDKLLGMYNSGRSYFTISGDDIGSKIDHALGIGSNDSVEAPSTNHNWLKAIVAFLAGITVFKVSNMDVKISEFLPRRIKRSDFPDIADDTVKRTSHMFNTLQDVGKLLCKTEVSTPQPAVVMTRPSTKVVSPVAHPNGSNDIVITSAYGYRGDVGVKGASKNHKGVDIRGTEGKTEIRATEDGIVEYAGNAKGYGPNAVYLKYPRPDGSHILVEYGHMKSKTVNTGDKVSAGQVVGYMGHEGLDCATHLHMSVSVLPPGVQGRPTKYRVNPMSYLRSIAGPGNFKLSYAARPELDAMLYEYSKSGKTPAKSVANTFKVTQPSESDTNKVYNTSPSGNVATQMRGITYKSSNGRDALYNNPMNVKGSGYKGQTGDDREYMIAHGKSSSSRWHAAFSDPYYSIKAAMFDPKQCMNFSATVLTWDKWLKRGGKKVAGTPIPKDGRNLFMGCVFYIGHHDTGYSRAQHIVESDPGAWPNGVDTEYDFARNKRQFVSFVKTTLRWEQGVKADDWYLGACWDAIFNNCPEPLQSNLQGSTNVLTTTNDAVSVNNTGFNIKYSFSGNHQ